MKFSIIVPTYNEEKDIRDTLESLVLLQGNNKEILVVDDSNDSTPQIVRTFESKGVRLIRPEKREGRCGARNLGILSATGDVVIILNADVRLPTDFLSRIQKHYEAGYDYVLVAARVFNTQAVLARYVDAVAEADYGHAPDWMEWTEGFSCRKGVAIKAGLFPVGFAVPICAGEDGFFGDGLRKVGAKKVVDFSIQVTHVAPETLSEYWYIRKGRGAGRPQVRRFLHQWSMTKIAVWALLRIFKTIAMWVTVLPVTYKVLRACRESSCGVLDFFPFVYAYLIEEIAAHVGEWQSIFEIIEKERTFKPALT